jgi:hypothetical protein
VDTRQEIHELNDALCLEKRHFQEKVQAHLLDALQLIKVVGTL